MMARLKLKNTETSGALSKAKVAVRKFEKKREELGEMREDWEENYPEADAALQTVKETEDELLALLKKAKPLVCSASQERGESLSIGDFNAMFKVTSPSYDERKLIETLCKMEDADTGRLLKVLYKRGLVTSVKVDRDVAKVIKGDPKIGKFIKRAWSPGGEALTPSVSVPKI